MTTLGAVHKLPWIIVIRRASVREAKVSTVILTSREIAAVSYDDAAARLQVELRKGGLYEVIDVPEPVFHKLCTSPSPGTYFHLHIRKGGYNIRRLR
nr:KTSC domain-containing protein [Ciceribacter sp. L1K23]